MNWIDWYPLAVLLVGMNLALACGLYMLLRALLRWFVRKMDIQITYLMIRGVVLCFLCPLAGILEGYLWRKQGYWGSFTSVMNTDIQPVIRWLGILWVLGAIVSFVYRSFMGVRLRRLIRSGSTPAQVSWKTDLEQICRERSIRVPECREQMGEDSAFLTGILHPVVYVPAGEFREEQRQVVLTHEMTHQQEHDLFWKWLVTLCQCIYWFCPLVYTLGKDVQEWSEFNCDYVSCGLVGSAKRYFQVMGELINGCFGWGGSSWTARFGGDSNEVIRRMTAMANQKKISARRGQWILLAIFVFLLGGSSTATAATVSASGTFRNTLWDNMVVVNSPLDRQNDQESPEITLTEDQCADLERNWLEPEEWQDREECWLDVVGPESIFFNWNEKKGEVFVSPEFRVTKKAIIHMSGCAEPDGLAAIAGLRYPDGTMKAMILQYDSFHAFTVEEPGQYRFFARNLSEEPEALFGYIMIAEEQ